MTDELHKRVVDEALTRGVEERSVTMTEGELFLFHVLLQDYGLELVGNDRFIPLLERSKQRIDGAGQ